MTMENTKSQVRIQSDLSDSMITKKGLTQGDSLACLLFKWALEKVRNAGIPMGGTIFYKLVQLLAYADDTDKVTKSWMTFKEAFLSLKDKWKKDQVFDYKRKWKSTEVFSN